MWRDGTCTKNKLGVLLATWEDERVIAGRNDHHDGSYWHFEPSPTCDLAELRLHDGWHHIALIARQGATVRGRGFGPEQQTLAISYVVDGAPAGALTVVAAGWGYNFSRIGNGRPSHAYREDAVSEEPWGTFADLRVYGHALTRAELELVRKPIARRLLPNPPVKQGDAVRAPRGHAVVTRVDAPNGTVNLNYPTDCRRQKNVPYAQIAKLGL